VIQAHYLGRGPQTDAFTAAYGLFYLPILLFSSCISSTLIPMYIQTRGRAGTRRADRFASNVLNTFLLLAVGLGGLMMFLATPLIHIVTPGFEGATLALTVDLVRVMLPSLGFVALSLVLSTLLNAREQYIAAQLTGFPLSVCVIFATVLFTPRWGVYAVAWGVFAAGIFQALIQIPPLYKKFRYALHIKLNDPALKRLFILAGPAVLSMAVNELNHMVDYALASGLAQGDVTSMSYAYKLITLILGVLVVPLTTVMFSKMSMRVNEVGARGVVPIIKNSMEVLAAVLLPITAIAAAFGREIVQIAFMRGEFTLHDAQVTGDVFTFYVIGILAYAYRDIFNRAFHASQETKTPMINATITMVMNVTLNFTLRPFMGVNGLALATSIASIIGTVMLLVRLRGRTGRMQLKSTSIELLKIGISAALAGFVALALNRFVPPVAGNMRAFLRFAACALGALLIYAMALFTLGARILKAPARALRKS
jgi:putative peptidoglycan lipid II flippase